MQFKPWLTRAVRQVRGWAIRSGGYLGDLAKQTISLALGTREVLGACALGLFLMNAAAVAAGADGATLFSLISSILVTPLAAGMITYAASARWEGRGPSFMDAYHLVRIRFKQVLLTGVGAGLIVMLMDWFARVAYGLIGLLPALLGWIPLVGALISGVAAVAIWLVALLMELIAHIALVSGMLTLTADGMWGKMQIQRAVNILWGGKQHTLPQLTLVMGLWIVVMAVSELLSALPGGAMAAALLRAALTALSMTAVSVIYLRERDRVDGARYHA